MNTLELYFTKKILNRAISTKKTRLYAGLLWGFALLLVVGCPDSYDFNWADIVIILIANACLFMGACLFLRARQP